MTERLRHMPTPLVACAAILVVTVAVAWHAIGPVGAAGAALGVALVVASYTASNLAIAWADKINPRLVLPVGLGMYVTKFSLFGVMMLEIGHLDWPGRIPMAVGIVLAVVGWNGTQIWWTVRHAHPYGA